MGSMNRSLAGGNALKALGLTMSVNGAVRVFSVSFSFFSHFGLWRYRLLYFLDCWFVSWPSV